MQIILFQIDALFPPSLNGNDEQIISELRVEFLIIIV